MRARHFIDHCLSEITTISFDHIRLLTGGREVPTIVAGTQTEIHGVTETEMPVHGGWRIVAATMPFLNTVTTGFRALFPHLP